VDEIEATVQAVVATPHTWRVIEVDVRRYQGIEAMNQSVLNELFQALTTKPEL